MEDLPNAGNITGGTYPARIWTAYMKAALEGTKVVPFPKPAGINKNADPPPPTTTRRRRRRRRGAADHDERPADHDQRAAHADPGPPVAASRRRPSTNGPPSPSIDDLTGRCHHAGTG